MYEWLYSTHFLFMLKDTIVEAILVEFTTVLWPTPSLRDVPSISQPLTPLSTPTVISIIRGRQGHFLPSSDIIYVLSHPVTFLFSASAAGIASESNGHYSTIRRSYQIITVGLLFQIMRGPTGSLRGHKGRRKRVSFDSLPFSCLKVVNEFYITKKYKEPSLGKYQR